MQYLFSWRAILIIFLSVTSLGHAQVVIVQSDGQDSSTDAVAGVKEVIPDAQVLNLGAGTQSVGRGDVVVALGEPAAQAKYADGVGLVVALVMDQDLKLPTHAIRVSPLPDAYAILSKILDLVPHLNSLTVFSFHNHYQNYLKYFSAACSTSTIAVRIRPVNNTADLISELRQLPGKTDALWLTPEPSLIRQDNFKIISDFCTANKIALIAPVPVLAKAGALAGVAPSYREMGKAAGRAAVGLSQGKLINGSVDAAKCEVTVNAGTARLLGLKVDPKVGFVLE